MRRAVLVGLALVLASCQEHERVQAPSPPPSASSSPPVARERVSIESALYAVQGGGDEVVAFMKEGAKGAALPHVALLGIDSNPLPDAPAPSEFERYFFVARGVMFGLVSSERLAQPISVLLLAGRSPPCFGTVQRSAVLSWLDGSRRSRALLVEDCAHPSGYYGALVVHGVAGAIVRFLDEPEEPLQNPLSTEPGHEKINEMLQQLNEEAQRRAAASVDPVRRAAELLPELGGTLAEVEITLGPDHYFIVNVKGPGGGVSSTKLVHVGPDRVAKVRQSLPR